MYCFFVVVQLYIKMLSQLLHNILL